MQRLALVLGISLALFATLPVMAVRTKGGEMTPEMRTNMRSMIGAQAQDLMVMMHNTAVTTPQGLLVVLQGNRLLVYGTDMTLQHTVKLPAPTMPTSTATRGTSSTTPTTPATPPAMQATPSLRSMVPAKLLPIADGGLIVVRGQQVIRLDANFTITSTAMLPDLPAMSPADIAVICPLCGMIRNRQLAMGMGTGTHRLRHGWTRGMRGCPTAPSSACAPPPPPSCGCSNGGCSNGWDSF